MSFRAKKKWFWLLESVAVLIPLGIWAYSGGPDPRSEGADGGRACGTGSTCHLSSPVNSGGGRVEITLSAGTTYSPGQRQRVTVTITHSGARVYGFQASARLESNLRNGQAGTFTPLGSGVIVLCEDGRTRPSGGSCPSGQLEFIEHSQPSTSNRFEFDWTAPSTNVGNIRIFVAGNAANGNGLSTGDNIYTADLTLTPALGGPRPTLDSAFGVHNGAAVQSTTVAPGSFAFVKGTNLAPNTPGAGKTWDNVEIRDGVLPTEIDGVRVTIGGRPAAIFFVSNGQINFQVPNDAPLGNAVPVIVTTANGESNAIPATIAAHAPGFYIYAEDKYIAALNYPSFVRVGRPGLFGSALETQPAHPGQLVLLYGGGFGPTDPERPSGRVITQPAPTRDRVTVTIGGRPANVEFSGLVGAGLYQLNVRVPEDLPNGDHEVVATVAGQRTQTGALITVQR
jgi:uncharacterized protein (TIGR03437 family)